MNVETLSAAPRLSFEIHKRNSKPKTPHYSISLLQICRNHRRELIQIHSLLTKTNLICETRAFGRLLLSFASLSDSDSLDYAEKLFASENCPKNTFTYNTMIRAYSHGGNPRVALFLYSKMISEGSCLPDDFTFTFFASVCSKVAAFFEGKQVHGQMVKCPLWVGTNSQNALMDLYVKGGETGSVIHRVFREIREPDVVSWNCLLDGLVKSGDLVDAQKVFDEMPSRDVVSWTTMLAGYMNAGLLSEAHRLFFEMPERNVVSWSVMIGGYMQLGQFKEAVNLSREMPISEIKPDKFMLTTLLAACSSLGALELGRWIHAYIDKHRIEVDGYLSTALVDMYGKCGRIDAALSIFHNASDRPVSLWNAMLGGFAIHSHGQEAVELFAEMLESGTKPNDVTFICILLACSHTGLVSAGLEIFKGMLKDCTLTPTIEHYGCVVDLLGRAGFLDHAKQVIETMPFEADGNIWRSLLGACRLHGDIELGEHVGRILIELEPLNHANYVLLSNAYASGNRWEDVSKLRRMMKLRDVRKTPGCSSIELDGMVHEFVAGDHSHPQIEEVYSMLDEMAYQLVGLES